MATDPAPVRTGPDDTDQDDTDQDDSRPVRTGPNGMSGYELATDGSGPMERDKDRARVGPVRGAAGFAAVVVVALLALFVYGVTSEGNDDSPTAPSPLDGKLAPSIEGEALDGSRYILDGDRGSWVVVNFFATWCPPCVQEHPELVEFARRHEGSGQRRLVSVVFGGANETAAVRRFFAANGGSWPVIVDPTGTLAVDYAVAQVPESILVSPTGLVLGKIRGGVSADGLDAIIDQVERAAGT